MHLKNQTVFSVQFTASLNDNKCARHPVSGLALLLIPSFSEMEKSQRSGNMTSSIQKEFKWDEIISPLYWLEALLSTEELKDWTQLSTKNLTSTCPWTPSSFFSANEDFLLCPLLWPNLHLFLRTCSSSSMGLRTYLKRSLRARFHSNYMGEKNSRHYKYLSRICPSLKQVTLFYLTLQKSVCH